MIRLFTYALPRSFNGQNIPIPVQSAFLRDYCIRNGYNFTIPTVEICVENSYYVLFRSLFLRRHYELDIGLTSILMLPSKDSHLLKEILQINPLVNWHFVLEGLVLRHDEILLWFDDFHYLNFSN